MGIHTQEVKNQGQELEELPEMEEMFSGFPLFLPTPVFYPFPPSLLHSFLPSSLLPFAPLFSLPSPNLVPLIVLHMPTLATLAHNPHSSACTIIYNFIWLKSQLIYSKQPLSHMGASRSMDGGKIWVYFPSQSTLKYIYYNFFP